MVSKPTGRDPHRPAVPLRARGDRYLLTFMEAHKHDPSLSERGIALAISSVMHGELVGIFNNSGRGPVALWEYKDRQRRGVEGDDPRNRRAFNPWADNLARTVRKFRSLTGETADGVWWLNMTRGWEYCLYADTHLLAYSGAQAACMLAGERYFFDRAMAPIANHRFGLGPEPKFSLPDFCPHA